MYRTDLRYGPQAIILKYVFIPFVVFFSSIIGGLLSIIGLSTIPDILVGRSDCFESCFFSLIFLSLVPIVLISTRPMLFQMQMRIGEGSMWVQRLKRTWGSGWVEIDYSDLGAFHLNRYYTLCLISKDGRMIEFILLSKRRHNRKEMDKVVSILRGKGIGPITEKEMIELFKNGKLSFL
jgi:hypothetical protein